MGDQAGTESVDGGCGVGGVNAGQPKYKSQVYIGQFKQSVLRNQLSTITVSSNGKSLAYQLEV